MVERLLGQLAVAAGVQHGLEEGKGSGPGQAFARPGPLLCLLCAGRSVAGFCTHPVAGLSYTGGAGRGEVVGGDGSAALQQCMWAAVRCGVGWLAGLWQSLKCSSGSPSKGRVSCMCGVLGLANNFSICEFVVCCTIAPHGPVGCAGGAPGIDCTFAAGGCGALRLLLQVRGFLAQARMTVARGYW